jgi:hypothetical protein
MSRIRQSGCERLCGSWCGTAIGYEPKSRRVSRPKRGLFTDNHEDGLATRRGDSAAVSF